jgi:hydrogenase nickel incorporation protein HypA/HybF
MHEFSVARSLVTEIRQIVANQGGGSITAVELDIGPLSGVEPLHLAEAFRILTAEGELSQTVLHVNEVLLQACCNSCGRRFAIHDYQFRCPHCGDSKLLIERGDGVIIRTLTIADDLPTGARL